MRGFFGIGIEQGKDILNYWTLFRTAHIFKADMLFVIGRRFTPNSPDTMKSYRHIPTFSYLDFEDFNSHRPFNCRLIGIEMGIGSRPLNSFSHPEQAIYLLGSEDNGLSDRAMEKCDNIIRLPGENSLNVSVAGSIVLYDRIQKNS